MARNFTIPGFYRSSSITTIKRFRDNTDPKRRDFNPTTIDFGPLRFKIARHFGFCFGVENAIEIAYRALAEQPDKRIFLLSEMIHNPQVNADLVQRGVKFLMATDGTRLIPFSDLNRDDIVIVPAFGTTLELQKELEAVGINPYQYDSTCPFVEKVWRRSADLGKQGYSVIVHGKRTHEETRATFSHSKNTAPTLVIRDMDDAQFVIAFIKAQVSEDDFRSRFALSMSEGYNPREHLKRVGVVNQTTMLATETQAIANAIKQAMLEIYGAEKLKDHFADTRDTLCYATHENQTATRSLIESGADLGLVVGGYNSSNTSHLVELCEEKFPTFYVKDADEIVSPDLIRHFDMHTKSIRETSNWLPLVSSSQTALTIALTSGASCPDATVESVIKKVASFFPEACDPEKVLADLAN
ncbi:4-hydroxy-3-methylbut-2-enyl diphosphate reductase [bacterium]|nr:4-hydroxy-3-methylbut-2-enyl diphosphate reductase [bacterium]